MSDGKENAATSIYKVQKDKFFFNHFISCMGKTLYLRTKPFSAACVLSCITTIVTTYALLKHAGTLSTSVNTEPRTKQKDSLFID